jgi:hypothetical protein
MTKNLNTKILFLFLNSMLCLSSLYAQRFEGGLIAGLCANQVDGDTQGGYKKPGFMAGMSVETQLNKTFNGKVELYYIGKGAIKKINGMEEFNSNLHYIEMPFLLGFEPLQNTEIDFGIAGAYLFKTRYETYGELMSDGLSDIHDFDLNTLLSVIYYFGERIGCNARFNYSIIPVRYNPGWFNNSISLSLIYKFK